MVWSESPPHLFFFFLSFVAFLERGLFFCGGLLFVSLCVILVLFIEGGGGEVGDVGGWVGGEEDRCVRLMDG